MFTVLKKLLIVGLVLCAALYAAPASALVYQEDYDDMDAGGLSAGDSPVLQPNGGVGDTPFMEGTRGGNYSPSFGAADPPATSNLLGNLEALYGPLIRMSYDGQVFTVGSTPSPFRAMDFIHAGGTRWRLFYSDSVTLRDAGDWVPVDFSINTNWDDLQAMANGWETHGGTLSWAETLEAVDRIEFFAGWGKTGGPSTVAGIDNFRAETVPEPTALALLVTGIIAVVCGRRIVSR